MKYLSTVLLAASALYASVSASPLIARDDKSPYYGGDALGQLGLIKDSFFLETAKCDLSIYNKKYDVDVKLLIIVVADIDKKEHKYYDGKKCYNKDCEYKRRYDNECDDYKKHSKCDKKEHYHERDCKEYYDEYKEYGRDCDYKRKWDNECDEWKKHGKCEKKEHCHDRDCKNYKKYDH